MSISLSEGAKAFSGKPASVNPVLRPGAAPGSAKRTSWRAVAAFAMIIVGTILIFAGALHIILRSKWTLATATVTKVQEEDGVFYLDLAYTYMGTPNVAYVQRGKRAYEGDSVQISVHRDYPAKYKPAHVSRHVVGWLLTTLGLLFVLAAVATFILGYSGRSSVK